VNFRQNNSLGSPESIASEIGPSTDSRLLQIVILGYQTLCKERIVAADWQEDRITSELCFRIQVHIQRSCIDAFPQHQHPLYSRQPKRGKPPTIDFVFRKGYEESPYLGFECKLLESSDNKLLKEYIDEGLMRFLSGKYSECEKIGGMVGYIMASQVISCVDQLNVKIEMKLGKKDCLVKSSIVDFEGIYESHHSRASCCNIAIYHLFMKFN